MMEVREDFTAELTLQPQKQYAKVILRNSSSEVVTIENEGEFSEIAGYWSGALDLGENSLGIVLRITKAGEAVLYSIDQGGAAIPSAKVNFHGEELNLTFPTIGGTYRAEVYEQKLMGSWSQGQPLDLNLEYSDTMPTSLIKIFDQIYFGDLAELEGYWEGRIGGWMGLFIYLQILPVDSARYEVAIMSPTQSPLPIATSRVELKGDQLFVESSIIEASFQGSLNPETRVLDGVWIQGGINQPLKLRGSAERPE